MSRIALLLAALAVSACGHLGGAGGPSVEVEVFDGETDEPLRGARVTLDGYPTREVDRAARAEWAALVPGTYRVRAEAPGWATADTSVVVADRRARLRVVLRPLPGRAVGGGEALDLLADPTNTAVLQRRGFYDRQRTRSGSFVTRGQIERRGIREFPDVLRTVPGVRLLQRGGFTQAVSTRRRECLYALYLDGVETRALAAELESIQVDDVAGVEVYRGVSEVPPEFFRNRPTGDCGVVLVWTLAVR